MSKVFNEVHMTRVLHTARISKVDSVMFVDGNIEGMVSFELGKKNKERCFSSCYKRGTKKNSGSVVEYRSAESEGLRFDSA